MKLVFAFLVFVNVVFEAIEPHDLNVTVFYESLCKKSINFFKTQLWPVYRDKAISKDIRIDLVPFGRADYTTDPWTIICDHGPRECFGNALQACFIIKNPDNYDQVAFASCCMTEDDPPGFGELCSSIFGNDFDEIKECTKSQEGIDAQFNFGERTKEFISLFENLPGVIYDGKYNEEDCKQSLKDFKKVVVRKLSEKSDKVKKKKEKEKEKGKEKDKKKEQEKEKGEEKEKEKSFYEPPNQLRHETKKQKFNF